jgi:hypothetical protein
MIKTLNFWNFERQVIIYIHFRQRSHHIRPGLSRRASSTLKFTYISLDIYIYIYARPMIHPEAW